MTPNNSEIVRINDLAFNVNAKLTSDIKKQLEKVLSSEFRNKSTKYDQEVKDAKRRVVDAYKKKVGFAAKQKKLHHLGAEYDNLKSEIERLGLNIEGEVNCYGHSASEEAKALNEEIERITAAHNPVHTMENKLIARLYMSTTMGEAAVILNEVMGNGQIPSITKSQMLLTSEAK